MAPTRFVWSDAMLGYDFGEQHPMNPLRLDLTFRLARELGVLDAPGVELVGAEPADDDVLLTAHDAAYVAAVRRASTTGETDLEHGLGTDDDPVFPGMHEAAARIVDGSVRAAEAIWDGACGHAVNVGGGMHHAMADHASGFCVYNDVVAAVRRLLALGAERVLYVDLDAHHGDGVEKAFWDDPRVLTVSVHESGLSLFPGSGHTTDVGGPDARGGAVNVALPAGTSDAPWLRAVRSVVPPLARAFRPQVVVSQHGCDAHGLDPLTNLSVSVDAQRAAAELVHDLTHEVADGRWLALGGGGYAVAQVVPRAWTHLLALAAHVPVPVDAAVPERWREYAAGVVGFPVPATMGDGETAQPRPWSEGYDPADDVDRIILATRQTVFPWFDLDPLYD
ncbi:MULTISPECIES: acetoin utilization protein AcuC [unclassified Actinotalea]|uniref:acetoin utilization protein AcuC n=1 Tax=unclassified Actinotalea TaxID=2638618 RepID=UPI0015F43088|nr:MULTISPECIES: acetoin utilization protein AcuC [unclassified Actinotalea]